MVARPGAGVPGLGGLLTRVNHQPAVAVFHDGDPFAVHVLGTRDGHITSITHVMDTWILEDLRLDR